MSNALYAKGAEAILSGSINLSGGTIKVALIKSTYTPNLSTDQYYTSISAYILNAVQTLGSKVVTGGVFDAADPTFTAVTAGDTAKAVVIFLDNGGANTTWPLIAYIDTITGFPLATNGGDITVQWDNGTYKIFSLV